MAEFGAYCASKWDVIGLTKTAAKEYAKQSIRVNVVCPATTTPMVQRFTQEWPEWQALTNAWYPVGRICSAEEVANVAVYWLSSDSCLFMRGETMTISGGL